ncbi:MAG: hypothetical protein HY975_04610 [Candidatus Kerfeldbacteria bacterium]|nr:hypothetical protein [Candidatus Kerfeldbacteria bacterium]
MKVGLSQLPPWLQPYWEGQAATVRIHDRVHVYYVISSDLHPAPKYFVGCKPNDGVPPFISDQVSAKFRRYMIAHEIYEWLYLNGRPQRCSRALEFELGRVPTHLLASYLPFRVSTFENLLQFASDPIHRDGYTDEQRGMFRENIDYLTKLSGKLVA